MFAISQNTEGLNFNNHLEMNKQICSLNNLAHDDNLSSAL